MDLSVVIPLFNEEESLPELVEWITKVCNEHSISHEIIMVDDGSKDNSWNVIESLKEKYMSIKAVKFRRNYGKSAALQVGFSKVSGSIVMTMDADLQDSPDEIPGFIKMIKEDGYDLVSGWKKKRKDPVFTKNLPSKFYNGTARMMTGIKLHDFNCGIKAYKSQVVKSIEVYGDMHRYIPVLAKWAGFKKIGEKIVQHQERKFGVTKFGLERFIRGPLDLLTVIFIAKFGKRPMHLFGGFGALMFIAGLISAIYLGTDKLIAMAQHVRAPRITQSPFFYLSLAFMVIGTQLFLAGFIAELVSRSSYERNHYLIDKEI